MEKRVRIAEQELDYVAFDLLAFPFLICGREGVVTVKQRAGNKQRGNENCSK